MENTAEKIEEKKVVPETVFDFADLVDSLSRVSNEGLDQLLKAVNEIKETRSKSVERVEYAHDCRGASKSHLMRKRHWARLVTGIDDTKDNGYALIGDWLSVERVHLVPKNSIVVECCERFLTVYKITGDRKAEEIYSGNTSNYVGVIKAIKAELGL